jgi:antitoxin (DNA-binding transcriptional repressor) of toxin-antitoxin stability system
MTTQVDIKEAKQQLSHLLDLARAGNEVIISEGDTPVARLTAIERPNGSKKRVAGLHEGAIWTSEDFDEPLPDDFWVS